MKVLVLNCGSSSLKFQLIETDIQRIETGTEEVLAEGNVEKIGQSESIVGYSTHKGDKIKETQVILDHAKAVEVIQEYLTKGKYAVIKNINEIEAVGHRVVHGGESFSESAIITPAVLEKIRECVDLAPLHNPPNILGYEVAARALPNVPHVAVFDTAFHQTMPDYAYLYALPYSLYEKTQSASLWFPRNLASLCDQSPCSFDRPAGGLLQCNHGTRWKRLQHGRHPRW